MLYKCKAQTAGLPSVIFKILLKNIEIATLIEHSRAVSNSERTVKLVYYSNKAVTKML